MRAQTVMRDEPVDSHAAFRSVRSCGHACRPPHECKCTRRWTDCCAWLREADLIVLVETPLRSRVCLEALRAAAESPQCVCGAV